MKKYFKIVALCLSLVFLMSGVAVATPSSSDVEKKDVSEKFCKDRFEMVNKLVEKHIGKGKSNEALKNDLEKMGVKQLEVEPVQLNDEIGIQSSNTSSYIDLPTASLFQDTLTGRYYAFAYFFWQNEGWEEDINFPTQMIRKPLGGDDGFALTFSKDVNIYSADFQTWDTNGNTYNTGLYPTYDQNGVSFKGQDYVFPDGLFWNYEWDSGFIGVSFTPQESGTYTFWQALGHTWSSTGIDSISIGPGSIDFSFSSNNNRWKASPRTAGSYSF